jgi:sulfoacetaldehyde dehydrogenase
VQAAYSSGTPCYGVGPGNAVSVVDETAAPQQVAELIAHSKTFDHGISCSAENAIAIQSSVWDAVLRELTSVGGHLLSATEKVQLQAVMWRGRRFNPSLIGQPAQRIAELAGISVPPSARFFLVEESGVGPKYPFSGHKLSLVATIYRWNEFEQAIELVNRIVAFSGRGHSCGIHTARPDRAERLGEKVRVSRIMVNQPQSLANSGDWTNGMPMSLTLGCGSWGRNSTSSNVTWRNLLNLTWVSYPIESRRPTDRELFGALADEASTGLPAHQNPLAPHAARSIEHPR